MRRVLLLNVTYEPLTTVGLRRAVCLVLSGKAEVVHDDEVNGLTATRMTVAHAHCTKPDYIIGPGPLTG